MAGLGNFLETALLNVMRGIDLTASATYYVALHTADPTDAGTGTEVTGGSYARAAITASTAWTVPADDGTGLMEITNQNAVAYTEATANWGTVTHVGVWDALTNGNMLWSAPLDASRSVTTGTTFSFAAGDITLKAG